MSDIKFRCTINAPLDSIWSTLMDEIEHPDSYNGGILGAAVLERFHDGILRSIQVPDADIREKVVFNFDRKTIESRLVGHPSLVGRIVKVIVPQDRDQSYVLESQIHWETTDDRVDGMIRRNMEAFITTSLENVRLRAEEKPKA